MTPRIAIIHDEITRCDAVFFRYRGRFFATVVAKAGFVLVPGGVVVPDAPPELVATDRHFGDDPSRSVEAASDLAPYLPRCDVTFLGQAHAPGGRPTSTGAARIAVFRGDRALVDRPVNVFGDRDPSGSIVPFVRMPIVYERAFGGSGNPDNPVGTALPNLVDPRDQRRPAAFGPISRLWGTRRALRGAAERREIEAPVANLPDDMAWAFFQCAPVEQQVEHLSGDEWIVLDGLHPEEPRVVTRLSGARALARAGSNRIEMLADRLIIDGDRGQCAIVWRGRVEIPGGESALADWTVTVGLDFPGRPLREADLCVRSDHGAHEGPAGPAMDETVVLPASRQVQAAKRPAIPYAAEAPEPPTGPPDLSATPWAGAPLPAPPAPNRSAWRTLSLPAMDVPPAPPLAPTPPEAPLQIPTSPPDPEPPPLLVAPAAPQPAPPEPAPLPPEPAPAPPEPDEPPDPVAARLRAMGARPEDISALMKVLSPSRR